MTESVIKLGKYEVRHTNGLNLVALRHGKHRRELTGDGLILAMAQRIEQLESLFNKPSSEMIQAGLAEVQRMLDEWSDEGLFLDGASGDITDDMASDMAVFVLQAMSNKKPKAGK